MTRASPRADVAGPAAQTLPDWPTFGLQDDVRPALSAAMARGEPAVLATLCSAKGGAPRGVGAQMLVTEGACSGFLSGGCIEADVLLHGLEVLADGEPQRLVYGEGGPLDIQLPCGSQIEVLLERIAPDDRAARALVERSAQRKPALWLTDGRVRACIAPEDEASIPPVLRAPAGRRGCGRTEAPFVLWKTYKPQVRVVVVGSEPTALALLRLAREVGFEAILVRPWGPEAAPEGAVRYLRSGITDAFASLELDAWTSVAILTHDLDAEHEALIAALQTQAFYVGALGSQRRIPERNAKLAAAGVPDERIARIRAPIGLPIGGKSPWAIAVSVVAEIVADAQREGAD